MRLLPLLFALSGCATGPVMVELPEGAEVWTMEQMMNVQRNYTRLATEILRLRAALVPFNCQLAEYRQ